MKILLIDTCGEIGSVALADTDAGTAAPTAVTIAGRSASERLLPAIQELAAARHSPLQSLGAVAVVHGPGSFTGVRVGLSAAKGLCEALNLPLIAISRLAVLADRVECPPSTRVNALLDAGRGEFYSGDYLGGICLREAMLTRDQLLAAAAAVQASQQAQIAVACEPAVAESVAALAPRLVAQLRAEDAFPLALRRIEQRAFDDAATLDANYLRRTDAEIFAKPRSRAADPSPALRQPARTPVRFR
jgi:tRNA threonylcarbamoyladenosine biosynthesis protein TsaB